MHFERKERSYFYYLIALFFYCPLIFSVQSCVVNQTYDRMSQADKILNTPLKIPDNFVFETDTEISNENDVRIYSLDSSNLDIIIRNSQGKLSWIIVYAYWCKPCAEALPAELALAKKHYDNVQLVLVTADNWSELQHIKSFLFKNNYPNPSFILDMNEYGNKYFGNERLNLFLKEFKIEEKISGYPINLLVDSHRNVLDYKHHVISESVLDSLLEMKSLPLEND